MFGLPRCRRCLVLDPIAKQGKQRRGRANGWKTGEEPMQDEEPMYVMEADKSLTGVDKSL